MREPTQTQSLNSLLLLSLALGLVGVSGCRGGGGEAKEGDAKSAAPAAAVETSVTVAPAAQRALSASISITGALTAEKDVVVGAKNPGKVLEVRVREGDHVRTGDVVAVLDPTDLRIQLRQQEANLASALTRQTQADSALKSARENQGLALSVNTSSVTQAKSGLESAEAALRAVVNGARPEEREQARKSLEAAQRDQDGAERDLRSAQLDLQRAQDDLRRSTQLHGQGAISDQQFVQVQIASQSAENRVSASETRLNAIKARTEVTAQSLQLIEKGARQEDRDRAEASVRQAKAAYEAAVSTKQVQTTLRQNDVDNAVAGRAGAVEGVKLAKAQIDQTQQALSDTSVRSPIDGYVAERKVEPGMQLSNQKSDVMRIVDTHSIYFDGQLSETQFSSVRPNQSVDIQVDALPGKALKGRVAKIYPVASSAARSFTAHILLLNAGEGVRPQMFGRGVIVLDTHANATVVARDAIKNSVAGVNGTTTGTVYVVNPKTVSGAKESGTVSEHQVQVETGYKTETEVEIVGDVKAGDLVVREASRYTLKSQDTVSFTREKPQTASAK